MSRKKEFEIEILRINKIGVCLSLMFIVLAIAFLAFAYFQNVSIELALGYGVFSGIFLSGGIVCLYFDFQDRNKIRKKIILKEV